MPFVDPSLLAYLFERAAGHGAAVARPDEWYQTTQGVYHADATVAACERTLADGARHAPMATFENLNTREEFETVRDRF